MKNIMKFLNSRLFVVSVSLVFLFGIFHYGIQPLYVHIVDVKKALIEFNQTFGPIATMLMDLFTNENSKRDALKRKAEAANIDVRLLQSHGNPLKEKAKYIVSVTYHGQELLRSVTCKLIFHDDAETIVDVFSSRISGINYLAEDETQVGYVEYQWSPRGHAQEPAQYKIAEVTIIDVELYYEPSPSDSEP